jgi:MFS family permease
VTAGFRATFSSLRIRNYRLFAAGQVVSNTGTWMQRVAQDWLVLSLSHNSGSALGITTALQFLPMLLFGLYGGVLADRYPKRQLLIGAQIAMGVFALVLGILDLTGAVALWHVYALAFALGLAAVIDTPTRQAFVTEMVGPDEVPNAVSLNSATFNSARIIGPAIAGVMISAVGTGWVFIGNAVSFGAVIAGLMLMRDRDLQRAARVARSPGQLRDGLAYLRRHEELFVPIILVGVVGTFGLNFQITTALMAKSVFHRQAVAFALLSTMFAIGALIGALVSARRGAPRLRLVFAAALVFGMLEIAVGLMPTYATFAALLVPTGAAVLTFTTAANSTLQIGADPLMRGRVMAVYVLVFLGGTPLGAPIVGWLAEVAGPRVSIVAGGAVSALATLALAGWVAHRRTRAMSAAAPPARPRLAGISQPAWSVGRPKA